MAAGDGSEAEASGIGGLPARPAAEPASPTRGLLRLLGLYVAGLSGWELWHPAGGPLASALGSLAGMVPTVGAVLLATRTARDPRVAGVVSRSWRWLAWSLGVSLAGQLTFALEKLTRHGGTGGASPADVLFLASYPLVAIGLLALRGFRLEADERASFGLDAAMITLGSAAVVWQVFVQPTLAGDRQLGLETALGYVVCDLALLVVLAIASLRPAPAPAPPLRLLGAALALRLCANGLYWYGALARPRAPAGAAASVAYNLAFLMFALAAARHAQPAQQADEREPASVPSVGVSFVPTAAAAVGYLALAGAVVQRFTLDLGFLVVLAVALTAIVLVRQLVAVRSGARLAAVQAARVNEARFRSLVQNASDIVLVIGERDEVRYHTPSAERFLGTGPPLDGAPLENLVHPDDRQLAEGLVKDAVAGPGTTPSAEWRVRWSDGTWHFVEVRAKSVPDDPNLGGVILTLRSVHERKVLEERLAHQAFHDPLTQLANRMLLAERLEHALARTRRGGRPVAVIFVDLDEFKNVNDSFGHATGDQLLIELAGRLLGCVRAGDTAARLGGDEFAVLVEEGGGIEAARQIAERVREAVRTPFLVAGREIVLGASVGIAMSDVTTDTAGDLLRNADVAMYQAKHAGKGQVVVFESGMHTALRRRLELEAELRGALDRRELAIVYQPIVALASGRIVGAEALLRWDHPRRGRLHPADFFRAAEGAGVLPAITRWVVQEACRHAIGWPTLDEAGQLPLLCVNVSPRLIGTREFVLEVEQAVLAVRLPPGRLVLELTEGAAVEDAPSTFAAMRRLRATGVRVAIDDFGTGYSSLSYLRDMPVDILKLDKLFVDGVGSQPTAQMLARGILDLARALGKLVVAEGIEAEDQAERLREYGCTLGQGFLFSHALEPDEVQRRIVVDPAVGG